MQSDLSGLQVSDIWNYPLILQGSQALVPLTAFLEVVHIVREGGHTALNCRCYILLAHLRLQARLRHVQRNCPRLFREQLAGREVYEVMLAPSALMAGLPHMI